MANAPLRLVSFALVSLLSIYLGFFAFPTEKLQSLFRSFGYWNIALLFSGFIVSLTAGNFAAFVSWIRRRESILLILACLAGATFLYTREGGSFKIIFDEQLLSNVALNLHKEHEPIVRESSLMDVAWYDMIDKRPLLFPFILSLVHNIFGYNPDSAFYLNFALTALFLGLTYSLLKRLGNRAAGIYGALLACFMPLIEQNSSGGGFEMLNLCGILIATWLAIQYWESPSGIALTRLALSLALLSHIRYESVLIAIPFAILILIVWWRKKQIDLPFAVSFIPLSFLPLAWQLNYIKTQPSYWQYSLKGDSSFDLSYFGPNIEAAFNFLFIPSLRYAGSPIIGMLGVCATVALIGFSLTRRDTLYKNRPDRVAAFASAAGLILQTLLVFCFTFGQLDNNIVSRLGLPLVLLLITTGGILLGVLHQANRFTRYASFAIVGFAALHAFEMYSQVNYTDGNGLRKRIDLTLEFAETRPPGNYLYISNMPRSLELEGYNNISISTARTRLSNLKRHLEIGTYDKIFVIQYGAITDGEHGLDKTILTSTELGKKVLLKPVLERSLLAHNFIRVSEITGFNLDLPPEEDIDFTQNQELQFHMLNPEAYLEWTKSLP